MCLNVYANGNKNLKGTCVSFCQSDARRQLMTIRSGPSKAPTK